MARNGTWLNLSFEIFYFEIYVPKIRFTSTFFGKIWDFQINNYRLLDSLRSLRIVVFASDDLSSFLSSIYNVKQRFQKQLLAQNCDLLHQRGGYTFLFAFALWALVKKKKNIKQTYINNGMDL